MRVERPLAGGRIIRLVLITRPRINPAAADTRARRPRLARVFPFRSGGEAGRRQAVKRCRFSRLKPRRLCLIDSSGSIPRPSPTRASYRRRYARPCRTTMNFSPLSASRGEEREWPVINPGARRNDPASLNRSRGRASSRRLVADRLLSKERSSSPPRDMIIQRFPVTSL